MKKRDITRIEGILQISLPAAYKDLMKLYPFAPGFPRADDLEFPSDAIKVIELNQRVRKDGAEAGWNATDFVFGEDGRGGYYVLDTSQPETSVFLYSGKRQKHRTVLSNSLKSFADQRLALWQKEEERALAKDKRREKKRWWQFWI